MQLDRDDRHLGLILLQLAAFVFGRQRSVEFHEVREAGSGSKRGDVALNQCDGWWQHGDGKEQVDQLNPRRFGEIGPRFEELDVVLARLAVVGQHVAGLRQGNVRLCEIHIWVLCRCSVSAVWGW